MALKLYDTLTRSVRDFQPADPPVVRLYACGPTVYDHAHIGNYRAFLVYDLLHRYLTWSGYEVDFVMNLTDVDDKTIDSASQAEKDVREYTAPFTKDILADARTLGILPARVYPLATGYVPQMVSWIERLEEKGLAYAVEDGSVFFSIGAFPSYGRLKGLDPECARPGARVSGAACEKEGVRHGIVTMAKGRGGGYQSIAATLSRGFIQEAGVERFGGFAHGHTYVGHPTACAAGVAVARVIEEQDLLSNVNTIGDYLRAGLCDAFSEHPYVGDIRGRGLFIGIELVTDRATKEPPKAELGLPLKLRNTAMENGLICYPAGGTADRRDGVHIMLAPPFIYTEAHADELVEKITKTLTGIAVI